MNVSVLELADLLRARLVAGAPDRMITGFASLRDAVPGDLSFLTTSAYRQRLEQTRAAAVLVPDSWTDYPVNVSCLAVPDPSAAFDTVVDRYGFQPTPFRPGIHSSAVIGADVVADLEKIAVGAHAVIEQGAHIGEGSEIGSGCFVGRGVRIGSGCKLFAGAIVHEACVLGNRVILHSCVVIGADGFGYEFRNGRHCKIRQSGIVQIDDDVEIGAGSMVDRARFGRTWIGEGTKIDNQVQIGHNVVIGKHCILVSGCGVSGSSQLGDYVVVAAQAGITGHVTVGSQCTLGARTVVTKDLPAGAASYLGFPARPAMEERRNMAAARQLPQMVQRIRELEKKLARCEDDSAPA